MPRLDHFTPTKRPRIHLDSWTVRPTVEELLASQNGLYYMAIVQPWRKYVRTINKWIYTYKCIKKQLVQSVSIHELLHQTGAQPSTSCRSKFKQLEILPAPCQYILSLMHFFIKKKKIFQINFSIHNINKRNKHNLHRPNANVTFFPKKYILCWLK
jgi:hypothetical protein